MYIRRGKKFCLLRIIRIIDYPLIVCHQFSLLLCMLTVNNTIVYNIAAIKSLSCSIHYPFSTPSNRRLCMWLADSGGKNMRTGGCRDWLSRYVISLCRLCKEGSMGFWEFCKIVCEIVLGGARSEDDLEIQSLY